MIQGEWTVLEVVQCRSNSIKKRWQKLSQNHRDKSSSYL